MVQISCLLLKIIFKKTQDYNLYKHFKWVHVKDLTYLIFDDKNR